jgi:type IV pilus assembly protein PilF
MNKYRLFLIILLVTISGCSSSLSNQSRQINYEKAAEANAELGLRYMMAGNYQLAMNKLKRALTFDEDSPDAHHYLAELYRRLNQFDDADKHYKKALANSKNDDDSALYNNYGVFLCGQGRIEEAEEQFSRVLENPLYQNRAQVYENLGLCMEQEKQNDKAEDYFKLALQYNNQLPTTYLAMARLSFAKKNWLSARGYIQKHRSMTDPVAESLWLAVRIELMLSDKVAAKNYGMELVNKFPQSNEASEYKKLGI